MATNSANASIGGQAYGANSIGDYGTAAAYAGYAGNAHYGYALKFTTPDFAGAVESIVFAMSMNVGVGSDVTLRYALCSSDSNKNAYAGAVGEVQDENQIATGLVAFEGITSAIKQQTITIATTKLRANTTYYLLLWSADNTGVSIKEVNSAYGAASVTLHYNSGLIRIDTGDGELLCMPMIDNGSEYVMAMPMLDNGAEYHICS